MGTKRLLKPSKGGVDNESVVVALSLVEDFEMLDEAKVDGLTQDEKGLLYDWAMRVHLRAGDNRYVRVPDRPRTLLARLGIGR